jgi:hypothetical protein
MRKNLLLVLLLVMVSTSGYAQRTKTIELKPIYKQGFTYYYDMNRVKSPYALQVPLLSLEDEEITRRFRNFDRLGLIGDLGLIIPFLAIIPATSPNSASSINSESVLWLFLAAIGIDLTFDLFAHVQLKKGIDRYNQLIVVPSSAAPGLSLRYRF